MCTDAFWMQAYALAERYYRKHLYFCFAISFSQHSGRNLEESAVSQFVQELLPNIRVLIHRFVKEEKEGVS